MRCVDASYTSFEVSRLLDCPQRAVLRARVLPNLMKSPLHAVFSIFSDRRHTARVRRGGDQGPWDATLARVPRRCHRATAHLPPVRPQSVSLRFAPRFPDASARCTGSIHVHFRDRDIPSRQPRCDSAVGSGGCTVPVKGAASRVFEICATRQRTGCQCSWRVPVWTHLVSYTVLV